MANKMWGFGNPRRNETRRNTNNSRRQMLDMGRQKYFRMDMDDLLSTFELGENKNTIAAALFNKMASHSLDEALDYLAKIRDSGKMAPEKADRVKGLLLRYSKWR
jgi:hypothetical protein